MRSYRAQALRDLFVLLGWVGLWCGAVGLLSLFMPLWQAGAIGIALQLVASLFVFVPPGGPL